MSTGLCSRTQKPTMHRLSAVRPIQRSLDHTNRRPILLSCRAVVFWVLVGTLALSPITTLFHGRIHSNSNSNIVDVQPQPQHREQQFHDPATITPKNSRPSDVNVEPDDPVVKYLDINSNSTISSDITAIWHNRETARVCVRFREEARCPHPSLVGRLSGKSVVMLKWAQVHVETLYCGSYSNAWIDPGVYFLEIILIHCRDFGPLSLERSGKGQWLEWLAFNFTNECLENAANNRLTGNSTYISIPVSAKREGTGDLAKGRWVFASNRTSTDHLPRPWFSRRQPQGCRPEESNDYQSDRCIVPMENSRIDDFSFSWNSNETSWMDRLEELQVDPGPGLKVRLPIGQDDFDAIVTKLHGGTRLDVDVSKIESDAAINISKKPPGQLQRIY
eukprot:CCRYP_017635-RB/>CCRYP_017635-RB protein AED:0.04 eAED:0.04 QI:218/1/1/1/0.5/0.33/3/800/389